MEGAGLRFRGGATGEDLPVQAGARRPELLGAGDAGRTLPGASGGAQPCDTLILDLGPPNSETIISVIPSHLVCSNLLRPQDAHRTERPKEEGLGRAFGGGAGARGAEKGAGRRGCSFCDHEGTYPASRPMDGRPV